MRTLIAFACLLFAPSLSLASDDELKPFLDEYARVVNELDLEAAAELWSQTDEISFIHPRGHQVGWEDIRDSFYVNAMGRFLSRNLQLKNVRIRRLTDDTAWSDFYWDFTAQPREGDVIESSGRETQIWKKSPSGWKLVHVHYSAMPVTGEREGF